MSQALAVSFFGASLVSAYWNGAATYYRGLLRALAGRGHRITFYEPDAFGRQAHRDLPDPPWAKVVVYRPDEASAHACLEQAASADLVVKASGVGVLDGFLEKEVLSLKSSRTRVAFWDVDAPATLERLASHPKDAFRALVPRYDLIFTYGGGGPVVRGYLSLGARGCVPIYNALDPDTHFPVAADPRFGADLSFLGNRLPDREARVDEFFFRAAALCRNKSFLLAGAGWENKALPSNVRAWGHLFTDDHNRFNCSPTAVLNVSRESMARFGYSPTPRIFEAAGAACCLVTDAWEGIEGFLEPDKEVLVAQSGEEVAEYVEALTQERALKLGQAARRRVLAEHTYAHRARTVEEALGLSMPAALGTDNRL